MEQPSRRAGVRALVPVAVFLILASLVGTARADYATGKSAAERGNYRLAVSEWLEAGRRGDARAQAALGRVFLSGIGAPRNAFRAAIFFQRAAAKGDIGSMLALGRMYETGDGVRVDIPRSRRWYRLAADHGDKSALERLSSRGPLDNDVRRPNTGYSYTKLSNARPAGTQRGAWSVMYTYLVGKDVAVLLVLMLCLACVRLRTRRYVRRQAPAFLVHPHSPGIRLPPRNCKQHDGDSQRVRETVLIFDADAEPHEILGLTRNASQREITEAYRRLMQENHPDKLGMSDPASLNAANRRSQLINRAYDLLREEADSDR